MFRYNYLSDAQFLKEIDTTPLKTQFIKIIILNRNDEPITNIEGRATGGSINVNGSSSIRRSGNISFVADTDIKDITNVDNLLSINKRVSIEIGFKNIWNKYLENQIIWFPQGIFIIGKPQISKNLNSFNISFQLKDKMTLLNGENGGILPCGINHHPVYDELGNSQPAKIRDILYNLLVTFGDIPEEKIIIDNVPLRIKNIARWTGPTPIYSSGIEEFIQFNPFYLVGDNLIQREYNFGENLGYKYEDFTFPAKELYSNAGETVVSVLEKIKKALGNYEYFFDIDGNFRFQEIKDYSLIGSSLENWEDAINEKYLVNTIDSKAIYSFEDSLLVSSYINTPQYDAIKNDIILWGTSENKQPIRYHLIIDRKPEIINTKYSGCLYKDLDSEGNELGPIRISKTCPSKKKFITSFDNKTCSDWRTQKYLDAIINNKKDWLSSEIIEEWPKIRNLAVELLGEEDGEEYSGSKNLWNYLVKISYTNESDLKPDTGAVNWFLDVLDTKAVPSLDWMSISNIGRKTKVINDKEVNCLFEPNYQNVCLIPSGQNDTLKLRKEAENNNENWTQVPNYIWKYVSLGSELNSAYNAIRATLHAITGYNESINVTIHPIYHLEPNTRISVFDSDTGIHGDYMLKSFSIPFAINGNMTLSCVKAVERI